MYQVKIGVFKILIKFFVYNWQVRDEWFDWCNQLTIKELLKNRIGGVENILFTLFLFHIIDNVPNCRYGKVT